MVLSKKQEDAIEWTKRMERVLGPRWFTLCEISDMNVPWLEIQELVSKEYLLKQEFEGMTYYRFRGGI